MAKCISTHCGSRWSYIGDGYLRMHRIATNITEIIPDDLPEWAINAMAEGQYFTVTNNRIVKLEKLLKESAELLHKAAKDTDSWDDYHGYTENKYRQKAKEIIGILYEDTPDCR